jgi:sulfur-oxidizing protein SoxX
MRVFTVCRHSPWVTQSWHHECGPIGMNDHPSSFCAIPRAGQRAAWWTWGWMLVLSSPWAGLQAQTQAKDLKESIAIAAASDPGLQIMTARNLGNCLACHAVPGQTGPRSTLGPSLQGVGSRHNAAALTEWVTDARQRHPDTLMPPFGSTAGLNQSANPQAVLSPDQIAQVVQTLQNWR